MFALQIKNNNSSSSIVLESSMLKQLVHRRHFPDTFILLRGQNNKMQKTEKLKNSSNKKTKQWKTRKRKTIKLDVETKRQITRSSTSCKNSNIIRNGAKTAARQMRKLVLKCKGQGKSS